MDEVKEAARIAYCDEFVDGVRRRLRHRRRRARRPPVGRPAPARGDRARHPRRSAHPDPRRGHVEPRQRERSARSRTRCASLRRGRTTFVIAHRLSTIRSADQILVLEDGRDRRARHARRADPPRRPLPAAPRSAVRLGARPLRQPGRGSGRRGRAEGRPRRPGELRPDDSGVVRGAEATLAIASGTLALMLGLVSVGARPAPPPPLLGSRRRDRRGLRHTPFVALGDAHGNEQSHAVRLALVRDPRFARLACRTSSWSSAARDSSR